MRSDTKNSIKSDSFVNHTDNKLENTEINGDSVSRSLSTLFPLTKTESISDTHYAVTPRISNRVDAFKFDDDVEAKDSQVM